PARKDELVRAVLPHRTGQALCPAGAGNDPEVNLRLAELRGLRGDDDVADHRELAASAEGLSGDRRDYRRLDPADRLPARREVLFEHRDGRRGDEVLLDVGACRERALVSRQHDATDGVVVVERGELLYELVEDFFVERIEYVGAVYLDRCDRSLLSRNLGI